MRIKEKKTHKSMVEVAKDCYDLARLHTKVLLNYLYCAYRCGGYYNPCDDNGRGIPIFELKEELSKREHIPSKKEGKTLRRMAAKRKT